MGGMIVVNDIKMLYIDTHRELQRLDLFMG